MAENGAAYHTLPLSKQDGVRLPGEVELTPLSGDSVLGVRYHAQGDTLGPEVACLWITLLRVRVCFALKPLLLFSLPYLTSDLSKPSYTYYGCDGECSVIFAGAQFRLVSFQGHPDQRGN